MFLTSQPAAAQPASFSGTAGTASGNEDNPIPLTIVVTPANSQDVLSINISGIPAGARLSAGTLNGDGSYTLSPAQLPPGPVAPRAPSEALLGTALGPRRPAAPPARPVRPPAQRHPPLPVGGRLPVWELAANETDTMIGYHAVSVIADAAAKGIDGFDLKLAFEAMKHSAELNQSGLRAYTSHAYIELEDEKE